MKTLMLIALLFSVVTVNAVENLVNNGSFDSGISHWENQFLDILTWVDDDGAALSGNGSVLFGDTGEHNGGTVWLASDFIPYFDDYSYYIGVSYKKPSASVATNFFISLRLYDENENFLGEYPNLIFNAASADVWYDFDEYFVGIVDGATQAKVILNINTPTGITGEAFALFDDVILVQNTLFKSGFE